MFDTKQKEYHFTDKTEAERFKDGLARLGFGPYKATIRKSLPEFRGHLNKGYSVFVKMFSIADELKLSQQIKGS